MIVYALAKGREKWISAGSFLPKAKKGYEGIIKEFIEVDANAQ
jgi:rhamnogalacturonyl hydrolase YesR